MIKINIKVGSRVQISKTLDYYKFNSYHNPGQQRTFGKIIEIKNLLPTACGVRVLWDNGFTNAYNFSDLICEGEDIYEINQKIIKFKDYIPKSLEKMLIDFLISNDTYRYNSNLETVWLMKDLMKNEISEITQCSSKRYRSFDDLLLITNYYFPEITKEQLFEKLLLMGISKKNNINKNTLCNIHLSKCSTIKKGIIKNIEKTIEQMYDFYEKDTYDSEYNWTQLFESININSLEDLVNFYKKHLENEI